MIDLIIKNAKVATASDIFNCDIGIDKEKIVFLEKDNLLPKKIYQRDTSSKIC